MQDRDRIIREAVSQAIVAGYYPPNEDMVISVIDATLIDPRPGATHCLYIAVNSTAFLVTRYSDRYVVEPDLRVEAMKQEYELREAVLEHALWHFSGAESSDYQPGSGKEAREQIIAELLAEGGGREDPSFGERPVVRDVLPGIYLAPGPDGECPAVQRQWGVLLGNFYADIGLIGYNEDGTPELVAVDALFEEELPDDDSTLDPAKLRESLTELEQALPGLLKYPSRLAESESTIYGTVLTLLLESVPEPLSDPVRDFLRSFHQALAHRQQVTTWMYNGQWFAGRVLDNTLPLELVEADPATVHGPLPSEREALEKLYETFPELR